MRNKIKDISGPKKRALIYKMQETDRNKGRHLPSQLEILTHLTQQLKKQPDRPKRKKAVRT